MKMILGSIIGGVSGMFIGAIVLFVLGLFFGGGPIMPGSGYLGIFYLGGCGGLLVVE